ncbi:MAG TPA: transposase [Puia sp.]|jgi:hypothetical protein|nr:transposase [Puia sp.]
MKQNLKEVHPRAGGIDVGSKSFYVSAEEQEVRVFPTFTSDCQALRDYLLSDVINDITGASGLRILAAILGGERDAEKLTELCVSQIKDNKRELVYKSLEGDWQEEHLFALQQAFTTWEHYNELIRACDKAVEKQLSAMTEGKPKIERVSKRKPIRYHRPEIENLHEPLLQLTEGKDPTGIPGLTDYSFLQIVSEVGTDMRAWPTEKHFASWLKLAPMRSSSGKMIKRVTLKRHNKAGQLFRSLAQGILTSKYLALGVFGRKIRARRGGAAAIKAIARKIACYYYRMMTKGGDFVDQGIAAYEQQLQNRKRRYLEKMAAKLNLQLVPA